MLRWEGPADAPTTFAAAAEFAQSRHRRAGRVSRRDRSHRHASTPRKKGGELKLATRNATLDLPRVFAAPIALDTLQGVVQLGAHGRADDGRHRAARIRQCRRGRQRERDLSHAAHGPGEVDITAQLSRGDPRAGLTATCRASIDDATRDWLRTRAGQRATSTDARLKLAGNLAAVSRSPTARAGSSSSPRRRSGVTLAYADALAADRGHRRRRPVRGRVDDDRRGARPRVRRADRPDARRDRRSSRPRRRCSRSTASATGPIAGFPALRRGEPGRRDDRPHHRRAPRPPATGGSRSSSTCRSASAEDSRVAGEFTFVERAAAHAGRAALVAGQRQARVHRTRRARARHHGGGSGGPAQARRRHGRRAHPR